MKRKNAEKVRFYEAFSLTLDFNRLEPSTIGSAKLVAKALK